MLEVVAMLSLSSKAMVLVEPKHPAYFNLLRVGIGNEDASAAARPSSVNDMTVSATTGRWFFFFVLCFVSTQPMCRTSSRL
jgi:hypothetical protein